MIAPRRCPFEVTVLGRDQSAKDGYQFLSWLIRHEWWESGEVQWQQIERRIREYLLYGASAP